MGTRATKFHLTAGILAVLVAMVFLVSPLAPMADAQVSTASFVFPSDHGLVLNGTSPLDGFTTTVTTPKGQFTPVEQKLLLNPGTRGAAVARTVAVGTELLKQMSVAQSHALADFVANATDSQLRLAENLTGFEGVPPADFRMLAQAVSQYGAGAVVQDYREYEYQQAVAKAGPNSHVQPALFFPNTCVVACGFFLNIHVPAWLSGVIAVVGVAATGCLLGLGLGAVTGVDETVVGAGPACLVGAVYGLAAFFIGTQYASSSTGVGEDQYMGNIVNLGLIDLSNAVQTAAQIGLGILNLTLGSWAYMADNDVLGQLSNNLYVNYLYLMNNSGIAPQMNGFYWDYWAQENVVVNQMNGMAQFNWGPNGNYNGGNDYVTIGGIQEGAGVSAKFYQHVNISEQIQSGAGVFLSHNSTFYWAAPSGETCSLQQAVMSGTPYHLSTTSTAGVDVNWTGPTGVYWFNATGGGSQCNVNGIGLSPVPIGATQEGVQAYTNACGPNIPAVTPGNGAYDCYVYANTYQHITGSTTMFLYNANTHTKVTGTGYFGSWLDYFSHQTNSFESYAEQQAQIYYAFLRTSLGYTSPSQVPSNCIIPTPAQGAPPAVTNSWLNFTQLQATAAYDSWLGGLAADFGASGPNGTQFCGRIVNHFFLNNITGAFPVTFSGWIYTLPVANATGHGPGNEKWTASFSTAPTNATLQSWNINGTVQNRSYVTLPGVYPKTGAGAEAAWIPVNFTLWPGTVTVFVPLNQLWEVPNNDPLFALLQAPLSYTSYGSSYLTLIGNGSNVNAAGTATGLPQTGSSFQFTGAALYVVGCSVNGYAQAGGCDLQYATIPLLGLNITCGTVDGVLQCGPAPTPPAAGFSFGDVCSWFLISFFCSLFGDTIGAIIGFIVMVLIILAAVYVVYAVIGRYGRGGNSKVRVMQG